MSAALDRVVELNSLLAKYRHEYYRADSPSVSDEVYDALEKELKLLVRDNPEDRDKAPVLDTVGSDLTGQGGRVQHVRPMLSLDNKYTVTELQEWVQNIVDKIPDVWFSLEPKVDGASCSLTYVDRKLVKAVSRGDGLNGEDRTRAMMASGAVPTTLRESQAPATLVEVRGEVWMPTAQMAKLNKAQAALGKKEWVSTRNLASGTMKLDNADEVKRRGLRFAQWDCFGIGDEYLSKMSRSSRWKSQALDYLGHIGFSQTYTRSTSGQDLLKSLERHLSQLKTEREAFWHSEGLGMLTDGLVFKVESQEHRDLLGEEHRVPNWACSYKYQDANGRTALNSIEWSISRNGKLTPVGVLDPIVLAGAQIDRVNLNNLTWMSEMGIDELPCVVEIVRSGDVIPVVTKVVK